MQEWIVAVCWIAVVVFAVIALGFLAYEISWKSRRLAGDRVRLRLLLNELVAVSRAGEEG